MSKRHTLLAMVLLTAGTTAFSADLQWIGLRGPVKQSAEDGLNQTQLSKKIGVFFNLTPEEWSPALTNVAAKFPAATPWVTWAVGELKGAPSLTTEEHEERLKKFDAMAVDVYLEVWPGKKDVPTLIEEWMTRFRTHSSIKGFSVDLEYYKPKIDDTTAKAWDDKLKSFGGNYRLMLKHWDASHMPATYRGSKGDMIFVDMGSEEPRDELNRQYVAWAEKFAPAAVAFQIGYPADEDAMDGGNSTGWWTLKDPIKQWTDEIVSQVKSKDQKVGILWVCVRSGKTYNKAWDLTKATPGKTNN